MRSLRLVLPVVLISAAALFAVGCSSATHGDDMQAMPMPGMPMPGAGSSMPDTGPQGPWALTADKAGAAAAAGLPLLGMEMLQIHYHAHLDVIVDGQPITVPQYIGIEVPPYGLGLPRFAPLHTHDTSGVIHIESATDVPYFLGQVFTEWGQPMTAGKIGPVALTPKETLRVFVNGKRITGDPAAYRMRAHDEIAVVVGPPGVTPQIPSSYTFKPGL